MLQQYVSSRPASGGWLGWPLQFSKPRASRPVSSASVRVPRCVSGRVDSSDTRSLSTACTHPRREKRPKDRQREAHGSAIQPAKPCRGLQYFAREGVVMGHVYTSSLSSYTALQSFAHDRFRAAGKRMEIIVLSFDETGLVPLVSVSGPTAAPKAAQDESPSLVPDHQKKLMTLIGSMVQERQDRMFSRAIEFVFMETNAPAARFSPRKPEMSSEDKRSHCTVSLHGHAEQIRRIGTPQLGCTSTNPPRFCPLRAETDSVHSSSRVSVRGNQ